MAEEKDKIKHGGICSFGHFHPSEEQLEKEKEETKSKEAFLRNCVIGSKYIRENYASYMLLKLLNQFLEEKRIKVEQVDNDLYLLPKDKDEKTIKINLNSFIKK